MSKKAILIGATGLIGADLLGKLLASSAYSEVLVITRKEVKNTNTKLKQLIIDFEDLNKHADKITGDDVFCCIGTTAKKTPDKALYKKIDYQYPFDVAKIAFANGAKSYHLVSSMGADANSSIFYSRTKGEIERDLKLVGFESLNIYQPSLLVGDRKEDRFLEGFMFGLMKVINPLLIGRLKKYRSIKIEKVASAMLSQANKNLKGIFTYPSDEIEELGR
ncbi:NAD-dependent epimerase/dehydratase family protein [Pedobacter changchengzhani]|uniref:NAD-dependent epimerase/dehydratase family protein n=1 Tax=Pedobacter changchengzhani TaxID=2529274 RepID=A0A4R5MNA0_9SPHI|nr:NAD-dependent epimerase/dehydratase family protein [Pedobacter changchengzhani]TDG37222.1 NAD-dependent epimerase/dehydratase family protein [Pedobacter changchengzhani]